MTEDHRQEPLPEASQFREATAGESSSQPRSRFCQTLRKFKKNVTKKVSKHSKRFRHQIPAVQNESASLNQNIEHASSLHPSDGDKPVTSENLSGRGNQGASGEPASKVLNAPPDVKGIPDSKSVDAGLQGAREAAENMTLLGERVTSFVSKVKDGPEDLAAADDFQTTYLQPLKIFDAVIENLASVWAALLGWKRANQIMVLGMLSAASKIILAQTERDQSVQSLLEKLEHVYRFMSQKDTLEEISSKRSIAGRIAQQTLECACFIRDYSEKKNFCESSSYCASHNLNLMPSSQGRDSRKMLSQRRTT
ncbi:uncharacterized protein F5147DRAFT_762011 [Suillus discolor]|uniref:Uncharacterized protein n=1 Tax=Suillus discolor TaxID=1912936 RepID=A0A9P7F4L9_9AGAM|nr:uncharacterized protein F5147DRAFT_762011 [Suillus discolor]KAG2105115.1 hypothetical protein F5147DRAFT_762011 [Suillus discolor]